MTRTVYLLQITDSERLTLYKRRCLVRELRSYEDRLRDAEERMPGAHSPKFDGMPKGASNGDQIASVLIAKDELRRKVAAIRSRADRLLARCTRIVDRMPPNLHGFALYYYVDGLDLKEAYESANLSESTARRYRDRIEGRAKEKEP